MPEIVDIAEESKKYEDEWLLFDVTEVSEVDVPVKGRLLCHGKSRDEIHEVIMQRREGDLQTIYTGDPVPPDTYVVL